MTVANVNVTKVLLKRGNTVQNNNYTGVSGELTIDTQLKTLRVHDGVTAGGNAITASGAIGSYSNTNTAAYLASQSITSANIGAFQTFANSNAATQTTSINTINANVGAYQTYANSNAATQATSIDSINANVGAFQTLANANAATQTTGISAVNANVTAANSAIQSLSANIGTLVAGAPGALDTLLELGNALGNSSSFSSTVVNWLGNITSNVTAANSRITILDANLGTATTNITTLFSNAATQAGSISTLQTQVYANANVATYLSAFDGNILPAANVTYSLGSETRQWRDLWVSNNTIYIGNTPVRVDGGTLLVNGAPVGGTYGNTQVAAYLPTYTGNIAGNIVKNGYTWTFSNTGTTTFPGNLVIAGNTSVFGTNAALIQPADDLPLLALSSGANGAVSSIWVEDIGNIGTSNIAAVYANPTVGSKIVRIAVGQNGGPYGPNLWDFGNTGTTRFPDGIILAPAGQNITMQSDQYSQLMWQNANLTVAPNMAINSNFFVAQNNATLDIGYRDGSSTQIIKSWLWGADGGMSFPDSTTQYTAFSNAAVATYLANYDGGINFTASPAVITGLGNISSANFTFANGVNILSTVGANSYGNTEVKAYLATEDGVTRKIQGYYANLDLGATARLYSYGSSAASFLGHDGFANININYVRAGQGDIQISTNNAAYTWKFDNTGNLILPGNVAAINYANGVNILSTVTDLYANAAVQSANIATLFSNAATQATSINTINNTLTGSNVGIGAGAGSESQGTSAVAVGSGAGSLNQGLYSVAIGNDAGADNQGDRSVAVGTGAGRTNQGDYAVAIGRNAGYTNQGNNSIIINATTGTLNQITANTFTVAPVRNDVANVAQVMFYNTTSKEITYGNTISVAGNINAAQYNFANGVNILSTVGANSYGNTQVATYLSNYNGDINFTSSTAIISNVDVITVGAHIQSPAYQFSNGASIFDGITGTYSNTNVAAYLTTANISTTGNITAGNLIGNISITGNVTGTSPNVTLVAGAYSWTFNNTGNLTLPGNTFAVNYANNTPVSAVLRFESSWTVPTGNSTQSFTVGAGETYHMWVDCNIPNGIIVWNATATVTNTNVPVVGAQYAWVYTGGGSPIDFTSIPNQFTGTANTIVRSNTAPSATTNRFDFGLNNTSGGNVTVRYGWIAIS